MVRGLNAKAAAPTGIAAANVEIAGTDVAATTIHNLLDLDSELQTKLDLTKTDHEKVRLLMKLQVLLLDEVSMLDTDIWNMLAEIMSVVDHSKHPTNHASNADAFGSLHLILFGDFKQLPPATSMPPFITIPSVHQLFDFRVLRQNRRIIGDATRASELENFHEVLNDISWGRATDRVAQFIVEAYVRGARYGCAERAEFEGSTSIFTKRRFRDKWNRIVVRRAAKVCNHTLKIKGRVRARGARGQQWFNERRTQLARKKSRTQALWNLHLAGDWHAQYESGSHSQRPHMMRCMLVSNLAVDQRFANGTQGRIMYWHPAEVMQKRKALPASHPELMARFVKEASLTKTELLADLDHMDITARQETLTNIQGLPVLLQLCVVPCYALTVHKVQALSIKHIVRGCLEGVFAQGQVYVLISRATDPRNVELVGLPPKDLFNQVVAAWRKAGMDAIECLRVACSVTKEFEYTCEGDDLLEKRIKARRVAEKMVPVTWRTLAACLNPQEDAQRVMHKLLDWIDRVDLASQVGASRPAFLADDGSPIFPEDENDLWWLTDLQRSKQDDAKGDEDGPPSSDEGQDQEEDKGEPGEAELTDDEDPSSSHASPTGPPDHPKENAPPPEFHAAVHWPRDGCESIR